MTVRIQTGDGRLAVEAVEPVPDLPIGREVVALRDHQDARLHGKRATWSATASARSSRPSGGAHRRQARRARRDRRRMRDRAEVALGRGTPAPEEALLRGFLLGEDDRIDPATVDDFKRSGLAHLLAVSGDT